MTRDNAIRAGLGAMVLTTAAVTGLAMAQAPQGPQAPRPGGGAATPPMVAAPPPAPSHLMVSEGGLDYGPMTRYRLESSGRGTDLSLGKRRMTMNVTCNRASMLGIVFRAPSVGTEYVFGSVGGKSGKVTLLMSEAQVDGQPAQLGNATGAGTLPATLGSSARFTPGQAIVPVIDGRPAQGMRFSATVEIDPTVPRGDSQVAAPTPLQSNGAFQVLWR
ncbi:hypothetical protein [Cupriavidus plantarum]|uniref:hypothetical protein n=1 Tax=Cupriavidus plantarum TaxID=942865 RepID=UPI00339D69BC